MKTNKELRGEAWQRLWKGRWFWRIFAAAILLGMISQVVTGALGGVLAVLNIQNWGDYFDAVKANRFDPTVPIPVLSSTYVWQATTSTGLRLFLGCIMGGITAWGVSRVVLKACRQDESLWLQDGFWGFRRPFEAAGLLLNYALRIGVGLVFFIVPGVIAFYRYRYVFYVKNDNPDWGVLRCFRECRRMMAGHKLRAFCLDLSYWKLILLFFLSLGVSMACVTSVYLAYQAGHVLLVSALSLMALVALVLVLVLSCTLSYSVAVGQALFYCELRKGEPADAA